MKKVNGKQIQCVPTIDESKMTHDRIEDTVERLSCSERLKYKRIFRYGMPESETYLNAILTDNGDFLTLKYNKNPNGFSYQNLTLPINFDDYCVSTLTFG